MSDRAGQVRARLLAEHRDGYYPYGTLAAIAVDVGISRERVRQIARELGLRVLPGQGRRWSAFRDEERTCPECETAFTWTARAQGVHAMNVRAGMIPRPDLYEPTCSKACGTRRGRRVNGEGRTAPRRLASHEARRRGPR